MLLRGSCGGRPSHVADGVFVGGAAAALDKEFVLTKNVTHIVNCVSGQVDCPHEAIGVAYLRFDWPDDDSAMILDRADTVLTEICAFINRARRRSGRVLIHSIQGRSRSCCLLAAWLMMRRRCGVKKALQSIRTVRPDLEIRSCLMQQLIALEFRLRASTIYPTYGERRSRSTGDEAFEHRQHQACLVTRLRRAGSTNLGLLAASRAVVNDDWQSFDLTVSTSSIAGDPESFEQQESPSEAYSRSPAQAGAIAEDGDAAAGGGAPKPISGRLSPEGDAAAGAALPCQEGATKPANVADGAMEHALGSFVDTRQRAQPRSTTCVAGAVERASARSQTCAEQQVGASSGHGGGGDHAARSSRRADVRSTSRSPFQPPPRSPWPAQRGLATAAGSSGALDAAVRWVLSAGDLAMDEAEVAGGSRAWAKAVLAVDFARSRALGRYRPRSRRSRRPSPLEVPTPCGGAARNAHRRRSIGSVGPPPPHTRGLRACPAGSLEHFSFIGQHQPTDRSVQLPAASVCSSGRRAIGSLGPPSIRRAGSCSYCSSGAAAVQLDSSDGKTVAAANAAAALAASAAAAAATAAAAAVSLLANAEVQTWTPSFGSFGGALADPPWSDSATSSGSESSYPAAEARRDMPVAWPPRSVVVRGTLEEFRRGGPVKARYDFFGNGVAD